MSVEKCFKLVLNYFDDDYEKTMLWFYVDNPALGGVKAIQMIMNGRTDKLLKFIENALDGNQP